MTASNTTRRRAPTAGTRRGAVAALLLGVAFAASGCETTQDTTGTKIAQAKRLPDGTQAAAEPSLPAPALGTAAAKALEVTSAKAAEQVASTLPEAVKNATPAVTPAPKPEPAPTPAPKPDPAATPAPDPTPAPTPAPTRPRATAGAPTGEPDRDVRLQRLHPRLARPP